MRRFSVSSALIVAGCFALLATSRVSAQIPADLNNSKVVVYSIDNDGGYRPTKNYGGVRDTMVKLRVLEKYSQFLAPVRFPYTLRLLASEDVGGCKSGNSSPHYAPGVRWINMCYQFGADLPAMADNIVQRLKSNQLPGFPKASREQIIMGLYVSVLMHETGHAIFDLLTVPVFGREEDAADEMAAYVAVHLNKEMARTIVLGFAYYWYGAGNPPTTPPKSVFKSDPNTKDQDASRCFSDAVCAYADMHGTSWQRMYNMLCIAYGSDHAAFQDLVDAKWLPKDRAAACDDDFKRVDFAFKQTVLPFVDVDLVNKVRSVQWFNPSDLK